VPRWCSGCGDNAILAAVQRLCRDEDLRRRRPCSCPASAARAGFPHYMKTYGFHGIHGRALPIAEGVKMARPDLHVFVNTGDGDCCSIGAAHWIHAIRYNMNMTVILHDNQIYGLTKKQASPTSPIGTEEQHHAARRVLEALNPLTVTLGVQNVSFVAQASTGFPSCSTTSSQRPTRHRGFSFVRIIQRCPEWLPKMFEPWLQDPSDAAADPSERAAAEPELARVYKNQREHDPRTSTRRARSPRQDPIPVGILYHNPEVPCYEDMKHRRSCARRRQIRAGRSTPSSTSSRSGPTRPSKRPPSAPGRPNSGAFPPWTWPQDSRSSSSFT
jgi:2-oxoglutarate/2-oxoacid ferredoxin oxidoreductase subunit beta